MFTRVAHLYFLVFVGLKCRMVELTPNPASANQDANEEGFDADDKRQQDWIESRISLWEGGMSVPGIEPARLVPLDGVGTYVDGKDCQTGQDPFTAAEARIVGPILRRTFEKQQGLPFAAMYIPGMYEKYFNSSDLGPHCASQVCTLELERMNYICGPLPPTAYPDKKSCLDGSEPLTEEQFKKTGIEKKQKLRPTAKTSSGISRKYNIRAKEMYAKNCKSGKCDYSITRGNFICASCPIRISYFLQLLPLTLLMFQ